MNFSTTSVFAFCTALACMVSGPAFADGLADLKAVLARQQAQAPLKATLEAKTWSRKGEGKELDESEGSASVGIEENAHGLQIRYSPEVLSRLDAEDRAKEHDPKAKTPTIAAMRELSSLELHTMASAASSLTRAINKGVFKGERTENWNGKPARVLSFEYSIDKLSESDRKYVKKYEGGIDIWIGADGTPLASRTHEVVSGSAFVVISFENTNSEDQVYAVAGDRLVILRREVRNNGSGAGQKGESHSVLSLQIQS